MNYEEKINYLNSYQCISKEYKELLEQLELIEHKKSRLSGGYLIKISDNNGDNHQSLINHLIMESDQLSEQLSLKSKNSQARLILIENSINQITDSKAQQLLRYRYIYGYTFNEIANKMYYNDRHYVMRLHKKIINKYDFK